MISLRIDEKTDALRKDLRAWLKSNPPPETATRLELRDFVEISTAWQKRLAAERWVGVHWPEQFGGRGMSLVEEAVVQEELAHARAPQLINLFGLTMVGPVLIKHGTEAQKGRFLSKILHADEIWCQGFSEPGAGSDLASLKTSAVRSDEPAGSFWKISGQKVWTSFAQYAQWCFVLVRTDSTVAKHKGLSYFLVPMSSGGISVSPLTQISGDQEFNEVFFDEVQVPVENLVGDVGEGWKIAISTLMYERVILTFSRHLQSDNALSEIRSVLEQQGPLEASTQEGFGRLVAKNMAVKSLALSHLLTYSTGNSPGPEGSLDKLYWSENFQRICEFALEILGPRGVLSQGVHAEADGLHQHRYLYSRGRTIAAGTSEIQRGIIAERVLGLEKSS